MAERDTPAPSDKPAAFVWRRLLSLLYDLLPVMALWFLLSAAFTAGYTFLGHHDPHRNIAPFSALQWLLWLGCWIVTGLYATVSWRRGGQTLGMRPWRLKVVARDGRIAGARALWLRYAVATLSLLAGGLGFLWSLVDRERRTWHDLASGTVLVRLDKA